jgi:hypothetical protein
MGLAARPSKDCCVKRFSLSKFLVLALAASVSAGCASSPPQQPSIAYGQWMWTDANFASCLDRAPAALQKEGYSTSQTFRGFFGNAGATSATIICYALGTRSVVTVNVASNLGLESAKTSLGRLAVALFGKIPSGCSTDQC